MQAYASGIGQGIAVRDRQARRLLRLRRHTQDIVCGLVQANVTEVGGLPVTGHVVEEEAQVVCGVRPLREAPFDHLLMRSPGAVRDSRPEAGDDQGDSAQVTRQPG